MSNVALYIKTEVQAARKGKLDADSYETPSWLFKWLDDEYNFDIDLCASDNNHKLPVYYTIDDSCINQDWSERGTMAFCNPPFSRGNKEKILATAYKNMTENGVSSVFVIPCDINNIAWFEFIFEKATKITAIIGRVNYDEPESGGKPSKAGLGTAIVEFMCDEMPEGGRIHRVLRDDIKRKFS